MVLTAVMSGSGVFICEVMWPSVCACSHFPDHVMALCTIVNYTFSFWQKGLNVDALPYWATTLELQRSICDLQSAAYG